MPSYKGHQINSEDILRLAGPNDPGYDSMVPKLWIRTNDGEKLIVRSQLDESDLMTDEERKAAEERKGQPSEQAVTEERRREAARRGMPPDQTPDPLIDDGHGRMIPNPELATRTGQAAVLEQEKANPPTIDRQQGSQATRPPTEAEMFDPDRTAPPEKAPVPPNTGTPKAGPEGLGEDQREERARQESQPPATGIEGKPRQPA